MSYRAYARCNGDPGDANDIVPRRVLVEQRARHPARTGGDVSFSDHLRVRAAATWQVGGGESKRSDHFRRMQPR